MYKTWKHCFRHIGPLSDLIWRSLRRRSLYEEEDREDRNRHRWIILYVTYLSLSVSIYLSLSVYISPVQNFKYKVQAQNEVLVSQYFLYIIDIYSLAINHFTFLEFGEINNILISIFLCLFISLWLVLEKCSAQEPLRRGGREYAQGNSLLLLAISFSL